MKLIVGLGNPGQEYEKTRHNAGFFALDWIFPQVSWQKKFDGMWGETIVEGEKVFLLKPQTYMNRSGGPVSQAMNFYKIPVKDLLVLHDEIDFVTGRIALKLGGSPAGHNGLKSIIEKIGTQDFARIRIGVDRPTDSKQVADWVLSNFKPEEKSLLEEKMNDIESLIIDFLK